MRIGEYELGERIRDLRRRSGLSQAELGKILGVTRQTVSRWESGEVVPSNENITLICQQFGVSSLDSEVVKVALSQPLHIEKVKDSSAPIAESANQRENPKRNKMASVPQGDLATTDQRDQATTDQRDFATTRAEQRGMTAPEQEPISPKQKKTRFLLYAIISFVGLILSIVGSWIISRSVFITDELDIMEANITLDVSVFVLNVVVNIAFFAVTLFFFIKYILDKKNK